MEASDCQGHVGTVFARSRIANTLLAMAEFSQTSVVASSFSFEGTWKMLLDAVWLSLVRHSLGTVKLE
jgi:hypothetical protein